MKRIGIIGLGSLGHYMAKSLIDKGFFLTVFDIRPDAVKELENYGAQAAKTPKSLGENSDIVFIMVQNFAQCKSCMLDKDGLLEGMNNGNIIITSTISPNDIKYLKKFCDENNIGLLDSPVSGGVKGARDGNLTMMVSGNQSIYKECMPVLKAVGSNIINVGDQIGQGQAIKAVNQHLVSIHLVAMAEGLVLGNKYGLDPELLYEVISNSAGNSWMFEDKVPNILNRDFSPKSVLDIQIKDLNISLDMGNKLNSPLFIGSVCKEIYNIAKAKKLGKEDSSSIVKVYEELGDSIVKPLEIVES